MAAMENEEMLSSPNSTPEESLVWVPLSLTLVEYPQGNIVFYEVLF